MKLTIVWKKKVHSRYRLNGYVNLVIFRCLVVRRSIDGGVSSMISRLGSSLSLSLNARAVRSPLGIDSFRRLRLTTISSGLDSDARHGANVDCMSIESSVIRASDDLEWRERHLVRRSIQVQLTRSNRLPSIHHWFDCSPSRKHNWERKIDRWSWAKAVMLKETKSDYRSSVSSDSQLVEGVDIDDAFFSA